ncbi:MAG: GAF domain-containing sensor histidine kinase [Actinomycetota bacterium]|nr:GAF domain-containing sensor histidine kinase [Actinomycetota bacterium]
MSERGYDDPELLRSIIGVVTSTLDLTELLRGVADVIVTASGTDACFVHLVDADRDRLVLSGASPGFDNAVGRVELAVGEGVAGWVAARGRPAVIVENKTADPRYKYIPELRGEEFTSMASVPMATRQGALVGVLNVHTHKRRDFLPADLAVLTAVGGLMAGAVENARLHATVAVRSLERARFAEQLVEVQERERQRIARDLHDGVSQRLASLGFHLSAAAENLGRDDAAAALGIEQARELSAAALDEARAAIHGLRPPVLDDLGLVAGFHSLARTVPGVRVAVEADPELSVPPHIELCIFRITQEALQNITKHSGADRAWISLTRRANRLVLEVADNGVGHAPQGQRSTGDSYGMQTMRERADIVGGTVRLQPRSGGGTTVRFTVPG